MASTISFLGFGSGQDLSAIVDALVEAKKTSRVKPLEDKKSDWKEKLDSIATVDSELSSFYTAVLGMDRINELMVRSASSSNENVLTPSVDSDAIVGSHTVTVNQLAQAETEVHRGIQNDIKFHTGVADQTASINDSGADKTFIYSYNDVTSTITVNSGDSLQNLMNDINNDPGNPGVTAKIVTSGGQDHLVLLETAPDPALAITVNPNSDMTLDGSDSAANFTAGIFSETINASGTDRVFQLQYKDNAAIDITVTTGTTLEGLKDLINGSNADVRAWILDDGGDGSGSKHLALSGESPGADYTIIFNPAGGSTLDGAGDTEDFTDGAGIFEETTSAQNAQLQLDGYPSSGYIERETNSITNLLEGVSLDLVGTGTSIIDVSTNNSAIIEKVEAFTEAFNNIRSAIQEATGYNADTGETGSLIGNYAVQIVKSRLDSFVSGAAPGFNDPDDAYVNLQQLGFSTDTVVGSETEGLLILDTAVLSDALGTNPDAVANVFSAYFDGITNDSQMRFYSSLDSATAGIYEVEVDTNTEQGRFRLQNGEWGNWTSLSGGSGNYYLTGDSGPETGIALNITYAAGTGIHTTELRLRNGVITELSREMGNILGSSGPLNTLKDSYNDTIENLEGQIDDEELRLAQYEEILVARFARLDALISRMTQLSDGVGSIISSLGTQA